MRHGHTVKFCYHCGNQRSHAIVESGGLKAYICERMESHVPPERADDQHAKETLPSVPFVHTGNCRYVHNNRL